MTQSPHGSARHDPATLSLACLAHMQQEEALLAETLDSLRQVRSALRDGDLDALKRALARQERIAGSSAELRDRRETLRREMAVAIGATPQEVTLSRLAAHLPRDVATRLTDCRDRLSDMALEVDRLNRANAALVGQSLDFLERFLMEMTAGSPGGSRYSASGAAREPLMGSIIEARG